MSRRRRRIARRERDLDPRPTVLVSAPAPIAPALLRELTEAVRVRAVDPEPEYGPDDLGGMTVAQLRARAAASGVALGKARTKAAIIEALRA